MDMKFFEEVELIDLSVQDVEEIYSFIDSEREVLGRYLSWVNSVVDIGSTRKYLSSKVSSNIPGASWYKITYQGRAIGLFGIKSISIEESTSEIGYWLSSKHQGKGIISALISRISAYLKNIHHISYMEIRCLEENKASISVAKRAGGRHTKTITNYSTIDGKPQNLSIYTVQL
jgi:ribosomal-protein-serine acetyltransferase